MIARLPEPVQRIAASLESSPLRARLARGAFWSILNTIVTRVLTLAASIVVARVLGKVTYGKLGVIQSTVGMFGLLAAAGMSPTATKYVAELRASDPVRAGRIIRLSHLVSHASGLLMALAVLGAAPLLAARTLAAPALAWHLRLGTAILFLSAINGAKAGTLAGFEAFKRQAKIDSLAGLCTLSLTVTGVWLIGLDGALLGTIAGMTVQTLGYSLGIRKEARAAGVPLDAAGGHLVEWRVLFGFSLPAVLGAAMAAVVNWLCNAIMVNQPDGYAQMGLYNAANQWRTAIMFLPATLSASLLPVLSNLVGERNRRSYVRILGIGVAVNGGIALAVASGVALLSSFIMASYGPSFAGGGSVLVTLAFAAFLAATVTVIGHSIASSGRMWLGFVLNTIWAAVLIGSVWALREKGAFGYAMATLIAYGCHLVTTGYVSLRIPQMVFDAAEGEEAAG